MRLLDLHAEVVVMVLQQIERVQDLARMDRVCHTFHSPPACMPTLLQRPQPLVQQALCLRAAAGAFADLATESAWAHLSDGEEAARMIRHAARVCALREQHSTAAEMLMLAAHRCPDAESTALVRGVLARSGYRPKKAERLGRAAHLSEMQAFCAMAILLGSGQARQHPWPLTLRELVTQCGTQNSANLVAVAQGLHVGLVQAQARAVSAVSAVCVCVCCVCCVCVCVLCVLCPRAAIHTSLPLLRRRSSSTTTWLLCVASRTPSSRLPTQASCPPCRCASRPTSTSSHPPAPRPTAPAPRRARPTGWQAALLALRTAGVDVRARVNERVVHGVTPLMLAARAASLACVEALLQAGADASLASRSGCTALSVAAEQGSEQIAAALLAAGAPVEAADCNGRTPLICASLGGHTATARVLLDAGANVAAEYIDGWTALTRAAQASHLSTAALLLKAGADVMHRNYKGTTSIYIAGQEGHTAMVALLLDSGAEVDYSIPDGRTGLTQAAKNGHLTTVEAFLAAAPARTHLGIALELAAHRGHRSVMHALAVHLHALTLSQADAATRTDHGPAA